MNSSICFDKMSVRWFITSTTGSEINPEAKIFYKQILRSIKVLIEILIPNLPVFLLCEIIQPTHKSINFVWK